MFRELCPFNMNRSSFQKASKDKINLRFLEHIILLYFWRLWARSQEKWSSVRTNAHRNIDKGWTLQFEIPASVEYQPIAEQQISLFHMWEFSPECITAFAFET